MIGVGDVGFFVVLVLLVIVLRFGFFSGGRK